MKKLLLYATATLTVFTFACQQSTTSQSAPHFEIRGLKTTREDRNSFISFTHQATIVVVGDQAAASKNYLVTVNVTRISGGDPDNKDTYPLTVVIPVMKGGGDFSLGGGFRNKKTAYQEAATWEPETIELKIAGYIELKDAAETSARSQ